MPVDNTGKERRATRVAAENYTNLYATRVAADQEAKRARGEIACAECCRLKQKCDKKLPCSSCVRRGCQGICPNGSLLSNHKIRYIVTDTEQLHQRLREMSERIKQLEDALAISEAGRSSGTHPLLREELLAIKRAGGELDSPQAADPAEETDPLDAFGTLTISDRGISRFIGRSGGSESLLLYTTDEVEPVEDDDASPSVSLLGSQNASAGPLKPTHMPLKELVREVETRLPSWERAWTLCETYLQHCAWHIRFVDRTQLIDELLSTIYKRNTSGSPAALQAGAPQASEKSDAHDLALLLMVFAMGALADLTLPPYSSEAEQYYQLACSILSLQSAAESPSLSAVQALCFMGAYSALGDRRRTVDTAFSTLSLSCILGATIGLHRDAAKWKLERKVIQRRRHLFWQIFTIQNWQGLMSGRPTMMPLRYIDCEYPEDEEQTVDEHGNVEHGFWAWRYRFAKEILYAVNDLSCATAPVKYAEITALDRKVREFAIPPRLQLPPGGSNWENDGPYLVMARFMPALWRDVTLLYIHRSFFAKAILDHPLNPLRSQYASSFLIAYRSSLAILKLAREHYALCPSFMVRSWMVWRHVFSAVIVAGTVVMKDPSSGLAPQAIVELTLSLEYFEKAAKHAQWGKRALSVLLRLRNKAFHAYSTRTTHQQPDGGGDGEGAQHDAWADELAIFGGQTRFVATKGAKSPAASPPAEHGAQPGGGAAYYALGSGSPAAGNALGSASGLGAFPRDTHMAESAFAGAYLPGSGVYVAVPPPAPSTRTDFAAYAWAGHPPALPSLSPPVPSSSEAVDQQAALPLHQQPYQDQDQDQDTSPGAPFFDALDPAAYAAFNFPPADGLAFPAPGLAFPALGGDMDGMNHTNDVNSMDGMSGMNDMTDFGFTLNDSGMDEAWSAFLQGSGLLVPSPPAAAGNGS